MKWKKQLYLKYVTYKNDIELLEKEVFIPASYKTATLLQLLLSFACHGSLFTVSLYKLSKFCCSSCICLQNAVCESNSTNQVLVD